MADNIRINEIYHADCISFMQKLTNGMFDLTITDIPYGEVNRESNGLRNLNKKEADIVTFNLDELVDELCRLTKGSIYIFCGTEQVSAIRARMVKNGLSTRLGIWEKTNPSPMNGEHIWLSGLECCVFGKKSGAYFGERCKNSIWRFPSGKSTNHPTEKPLALISYLMSVSSKIGDIVFDPFLGSGTTAIAAINSGRKFLGVELNNQYYLSAKKRIEEESRQENFFNRLG